MEIADYIPNYPELDDPKFNDKIFHKKEFYDLRTDSGVNPIGKPGDLWPHQQAMARFLAPYTPFMEQILFHTPGTGKTCAASAIAEMNKQDPLIRKPILIIVPNETLAEQWKKQIALTCTYATYVPEDYFTDKLTAGQKTTRINKLLRPVYHITTMEKMRRYIDKYGGKGGDKILRDRFSNTLIIIDEAHNLRIQSNTSSKNVKASRDRYKAFHRFLHLLESTKKVLLTGTPMYDSISELPGLGNLILPLDMQLPTGAKFTKKYLKKDDSGLRKLVNTQELFKYFVGRVSYIREGGNFPRRVDLGEAKWTNFLKTLNVTMSPFQRQGYLKAYNKDVAKEENKVSGLWKNSRQAAVFVYEKDGEHVWGSEAAKILVQKGKPAKIMIKKREVKIFPETIKSEYRKDIKDNLKKYSAKIAEAVSSLQENPNDPHFIFTPLVSGAGGAIFVGLILELFGFRKARGNETTPGLRYALITGDDKSSIQRNALIEMFNSPENANGEMIQVMIATKTISEGTSFINVKREIVISPYWNNSGTEQAVGRGLRANSLPNVPAEERKVRVAELAIDSKKLPETKNIDAHMYKMSERKDYEIKEGERFLKRVAWDCALNYDRNVRENDDDNTRSCDYQKCNYVCYQVKPKKIKPKWSYTLTEEELNDDTYLLYYYQPEMMKIVEKIKKILRKYAFIDVRGLDNLMDTNSFKLFILAVEYIIENHSIVYNKWGQACFLRREGNILFLSDIPTEKSITGSWYSQFPFANQQNPLSEVIDSEILATDSKQLDNFSPTDKNAKQIIDGMNIESKIFIFESLIKMKPSKMTTTQKKLYNAFTDLFKDNVFKVGGTVVHNLEKIKGADDLVDFTKGDGGTLRCYKNDEWVYCDKKEEDEIMSAIGDLKEQSNIDITDNKYGVYGIITEAGKFQIADKTQEKKTIKSKLSEKTADTDRRTKYTGRVCNTWDKWKLINIYLRVGAKPSIPLKTDLKKKTELLAQINKNNVAQAVPKNADIKTLQTIYTLSTQKIADLCSTLEKWFVANNLVIKK